MKERILTGILLAILLIAVFFFGQHFFIFQFTLSIISFICMKEILSLTKDNQIFTYSKMLEHVLIVIVMLVPWLTTSAAKFVLALQLLLLLFYFLRFIISKTNQLPFLSYNILMSSIIGGAIYSINYFYSANKFILLYFFLIAFGTDTFAYFGGMLLGKHKLIPWVSPKKTLEGAGIAVIATTIFVVIIEFILVIINPSFLPVHQFYSVFHNPFFMLPIIALLSISAQCGDLFFSKVKRYFEVKDYGNFLPGHGGALDRVDSLIFVAIVFLLISFFF